MTYQTRRQLPLDVMVLVPLLVLIVFSYVPMAGIVIAFQKFIPARGLFGDQKWIGLDNFIYVANLPHAARAVRNSLIIASLKIVFGLAVPIVVALLLNEIRIKGLRRTIQTVIYLPHFLSWVILAGVLIDILSPSRGFVNRMLSAVGFEPIFFLADPGWFRVMIIVSHVWKEFGFGTIIYLAAITTIDPGFYEAAVMDGARRLRQMWHITIPGMAMVIVLIAALSLGSVLNAGFEQILNLYNPLVYETGDIIDTPGLSQFRRRTFYVWIMFFTMLFSGGLIPTYMVVRQLGLIDSIWALVLPAGVPVWNVLILLNFFRRLPVEMEESAAMDGAGHWTILWKIYIPASLAALATLVLFAAVTHWNAWFAGMIYMRSLEKYPLQTFLRSIVAVKDMTSLRSMTLQEARDYATISYRTMRSAQILIGALPILLLYPFLQRYFVKGIVIGSVKG